MNISCPSCRSRYSVDDRRVPASGVTIRCPNCTHVFVAKPPAPSDTDQTVMPSDPHTVALPGNPGPSQPSRGAGSGALGSEGATHVGPSPQTVALPSAQAPGPPPPGPAPAPKQPPPRQSARTARPPPGAGTSEAPTSAAPRNASAVPLPSAGPSGSQTARPQAAGSGLDLDADLPAPKGAWPPAASGPTSAAGDADGLDLGFDDPPGSPAGRLTATGGMDGDLDLGLENTPPPSVAPNPPPGAGGGLPDDLPGLRGGAPGPAINANTTGQLNFIDETAGKAPDHGGPHSEPEFKVRRRNGRIEGPYGLGHIMGLLRAGDLTGSEDISEDGVAWRAMTSHPELNRTMNELASEQDDGGMFGDADLPAPSGLDLPAPAGLDLPGRPDMVAPRQASGSLPTGAGNLGGSADLEGLQLDTGALPSGAPSGDLQQAWEDLGPPGSSGPAGSAGSGSPEAPPPSRSADLRPGGRSQDLLEVGEIPELPPIWQTYRKQIIAFAGVVGVVVIGVLTQLFTSYGAFGIPALVDYVLTPAPPPVPRAPPPPPPKVADPEQLAELLEEGSFEAYRSIFATVRSAGMDLVDNQLWAAKAAAFATLDYGAELFEVQQAEATLARIRGADLSGARKNDPDAAALERFKASAALAIAKGEANSVVAELAERAEARPDDPELHWLWGEAELQRGNAVAAMDALDRSLVADSTFARAAAALGRATLAARGPAGRGDAVRWYSKAAALQPEQALHAREAARILDEMKRPGEARIARRKVAEHAARGLPPDQRATALFEVARAYDRLGRLDEVEELALEAARLDPSKPEIVALGAVARIERNELDAAMKELETLLARNPRDVEALLGRARAHMAQQDVAKAFLDLDEARAAAPREPRISLWEARFHQELGKYRDARRSLARTVRIAPEDPTPHIVLAQLDLESGDVDAAFEEAQQSVELGPTDFRAHVALADCYARRGQLQEALSSYERAYALDPTSLEARLGRANMLRAMASRADEPSQSLELARAIPLYMTALSEQPQQPQVMFEFGRALELDGDLRAALALYEQAAAQDAKDVRPHLRMAAAYLDRKPVQLDKAKTHLSTAVTIERRAGMNVPEVRYWQARLAVLEGNHHDAVASMRQAVEKEPRNAEYQYFLGRALEKNNSLYEAITAYEQAVRLNSRLGKAQRALGRTSLERYQFSKAREWFERYRKTVPDDPTIWIDVGNSYMKQNKTRQAMKAYQRALRDLPEEETALIRVGMILSRQGKERQARRYFEKVTRINDENGEAWCLLGISLSQRRVTRTARQALDRCIAIEGAPADLRQTARNILETPSR